MDQQKTMLFKVLTGFVGVLTILAVVHVVTGLKEYRFIGGGVPASNTITVTGSGEVFGAPDIATISFTVREEGKKVAEAQQKVNEKIKKALDAIKKIGIDDKDVKTENYSSYPKYEYQATPVACVQGVECYPRPGKEVLVGYQASQYVTVKVRDLDKVSSVVEALGAISATDIQGPSYEIDKEDDLKAEARKQAIDKARAKAETLARDLGVSLVRITSFSESGDGYPMTYAAKAVAEGWGVGGADATMPELPRGEQKITSNVSISYEIR